MDGEPARIQVIVTGVTWPPADGGGHEDWRSAVESIGIDPDYDGHTLHVALADAPLKRTQLVAGTYLLPAPATNGRVAVRVTDIWGRETLVVQDAPARENTGT